MTVLVVFTKQLHLDLMGYSGLGILSNENYQGHVFADNDLVLSTIHVYNKIVSHLHLHQGCAHQTAAIMTLQTNSRALLNKPRGILGIFWREHDTRCS